MRRFDQHNENLGHTPVLLAMGSACAENMQTTIAAAMVGGGQKHAAPQAYYKNKNTAADQNMD